MKRHHPDSSETLMTAAPISSFSSLLEIAFGMNAVSGVIQERVKDDYALFKKHLSSAASEYCDESGGHSSFARDSLNIVSRSFTKRLGKISKACSAIVITFCIAALLLLLTSSLYPSYSIGNIAIIIIVSSLITGPILVLAVSIVLSKASAISAQYQIKRICLDLESNGCHPSGVISMQRIGENIGISMPSDNNGVLHHLAAWLAGERSIKLNMSEIEPELATLLQAEGKDFTEKNAYEEISKSMGFLLMLYEKEKRSPGSTLSISRNGEVKIIPIREILDGVFQDKDPAEIFSFAKSESKDNIIT